MKRDTQASEPVASRPGVETAYWGETARGYLAGRRQSLKWRLEQQTVETLLGTLPAGSTVLDVPVGTGRFLPAFAAHSLRFVGIDISRDMLLQARAERHRLAPASGRLAQATVQSLPLPDRAVDYVLSIRLLNWFDRDAVRRTLRELERVCRRGVIVGVRLATPLGWRRLPRLAAELVRHPASSLRRLTRRRPAGTGPTLTNHPETEFLALLDELHLSVVNILPLAEGTACTRELFRYTPLRIFVLAPVDAAPGNS